VLSVAGALAPVLSSERFTAVVLKSTVPVGTGEKVFAVIADGSPSSVRFAVLSNPEFLKEGCAVEDFLRPMRVIVGIGPSRGLEAEPGGAEERLRTLMRQLYQPVVRTNDRLLFCHSRAAELCKYASNAYLAMRVSFINDIANLCEQVGADVEMVRRGMGMDRRIGDSFLFPGMGYGGSCFPKDTLALAALARAHGLELPLVEATDRINNRQRLRLFHKLRRHFGLTAATADDRTELAGKTVAVWGLAFKPETDDVREAPALALIERLLAAGATVRASDPKANASAAAACAQRGLADRLSFFASAYEAATGADALVVCTEWREFRQPNFQRLKLLLRGNGLFDGRNIWDGNLLRQLGFHYYAIGR
jgi:UDPglucose 6-dehydrogenase